MSSILGLEVVEREASGGRVEECEVEAEGGVRLQLPFQDEIGEALPLFGDGQANALRLGAV